MTRVNSWRAHLVDKVNAAEGRRLPAAGAHAGGPPWGRRAHQTHMQGWSREERSQEGRLRIPPDWASRRMLHRFTRTRS